VTSPIHFYLTFNPHLNKNLESSITQAHQFHKYLQSELESNPKAYAYWGKMIGKHRDSHIDHDLFKQILAQNKENGVSTHLYITDFQHLWVGKVEDVLKNIGNDFKTLPFYKGKKVEVWFKISDFTLLEHTHELTAQKLSELYIDNKHMKLKIDEMSPFTTGIKYPAFIQDLAEEMYFDEIDETECSHLALQYNPGIESTAISRVVQCVQALALPEHLYSKMPHSAKTEIETAEIDILEQRNHNLNKIAFSYIKAVEIILNDLIIHHLKRSGYGDAFFVKANEMPPKLYFEMKTDDLIPISKFPKNYSIGTLLNFVQRGMKANHFGFRKVFDQKSEFVNYVLKELPAIFEDNQILKIRGILAHNDSSAIDPHDAMAVRNIMLGIGCKGVIHSLYHNFFKNDFKNIAKVMKAYSVKSQNQKKAA
jgi:hypothetical protein